jgi:hypothetical protein
MYAVRFVDSITSFACDWSSPLWMQAETMEIGHFRPEGSDHRPPTFLRMLYTNDGIAGIFRVEDFFIKCTHVQDMSDIWKDSCVEIFLQPSPDVGYFNFEFNCGGALLASYITDHTRTPEGFNCFSRFTLDECSQVIRKTTLPRNTILEINAHTVWLLQFFIPFPLLAKYTGEIGPIEGQIWRANAYKCGDETSHPHWASWQPLPEKNFHLPKTFGDIIFVRKSRVQ